MLRRSQERSGRAEKVNHIEKQEILVLSSMTYERLDVPSQSAPLSFELGEISMATVAQMEANCLNAQKSTGPRSAEGKASTRFNAFKHGAYARARVIPGEKEDDLLQAIEDHYSELQHVGV